MAKRGHDAGDAAEGAAVAAASGAAAADAAPRANKRARVEPAASVPVKRKTASVVISSNWKRLQAVRIPMPLAMGESLKR